jgi:hypothetical protein
MLMLSSVCFIGEQVARSFGHRSAGYRIVKDRYRRRIADGHRREQARLDLQGSPVLVR